MADAVTTDRLVEALARGLGAAVEAVGGQPFTVEAGVAGAGADLHPNAHSPRVGGPGWATPIVGGPGWATPIVGGGGLDGTLTAWIDQAGVGAIARVMLNIDDDPDPSVVADMLRGLWTEAASAATAADGVAGLTLTSGTPAAGELPSGAGWVLRRGGTIVATIAMTGTLRVDAGQTPAAQRAGAAPSALAGRELPGNLAALLDIDLPLVARFARTEMTLRALTQLGPGSVVDMGRSPDAPVQLLVGSQVVAQGEVVVVGGNYGVRITHLVSPAERLRAMEL